MTATLIALCEIVEGFFPLALIGALLHIPYFRSPSKKQRKSYSSMALQHKRETANVIDCLLKYYIYIYIYKYKYIYTHTFVYKHVYSQSMSYLRKAAEGVLSAVRRERVLFLLLLFLLKCCSLCFWAKDVSAALLGSLLLNRRAFPAINMHGKCRFCCSEQSCSLVMCQALAI